MILNNHIKYNEKTVKNKFFTPNERQIEPNNS